MPDVSANFCGSYRAPRRSAHHHSGPCGSVVGLFPHADKSAPSKPFEGPPGHLDGSVGGDQQVRQCHCHHVDKLRADLDVLKIRMNKQEGRINGMTTQHLGMTNQYPEASAYGGPNHYYSKHPGAPQDHGGSQTPQGQRRPQASFALPLN